MRLPIRGIQIALIVAFFATVVGEIIQYYAVYADAAELQYDPNTSMSLRGRFLEDIAYSVFYLGEAAILEVLIRILDRLNKTEADT